MSQRNADEPIDDAATVVPISRYDTMVDSAPCSPASVSDPHLDKIAPDAAAEAAAPEGLEDQTNFLPTRQVILVFLGLSIALACSMLDQTM